MWGVGSDLQNQTMGGLEGIFLWIWDAMGRPASCDHTPQNVLRFLLDAGWLIRDDVGKLALCAHSGLKPYGPSGTMPSSSQPASIQRRKLRNRFVSYDHSLQD